jgi:hypothetical protein
MVGVSDDVQIFLLAVTSVLILVGVMAVFKELKLRGVWYYAHRAEVEVFLRGGR